MFEENDTLVTEEVTENVEEQTTEEIVDGEETESIDQESVQEVEQPKMYTEAELEEIKTTIKLNAKKNAERKIRREYEKKYGRAETVLKAGLQKDNFEEAVTELENYYTQEGVNIPKYNPNYNLYDMEAGAEKEATAIIEAGYDELVEEVDRYASIGLDKMSDRDKIIFNKIAGERKRIEEEKELASIGIGKDSITDEFKEFSKKLNPSLTMKEKYEMYTKFKPKPKVEPIGSLKNTTNKDSGVKDFYTREEALKFTKKDFDKNPALFKAVENSMSKW
ncbi:MAG: hypothetical protein IKL65_00265 [Bacilli bacterium]|nr:hypothetical protein [Bacilli bacterium]